MIMMPNYLQIWGIARTLQVTVKEFYLQPENKWRPDLEKLADSITERTKLISVCHPNNPTGMVFQPEEMEKIISLAQANQIWLHSDEVYRGAELTEKETPSFWGKYERVIVTAGLSKAYGLAGLRLGWLVAPEIIISRAWEAHDYTCITAGTLSNHLALLALQPEIRPKILSRSRQILQRNLQILTSWVEEHADVLDFIPPQAGGVAFLHYHLPLNSTQLVEQLRDEKSVLVVPGESLGLDKFFRLGLGVETSVLQEGLQRIGEFIRHRKNTRSQD
ncbi:MAG TPA: aminotransferase class I/II-fold pyridoxal phosphate-dependent enzyme [Candidatus Aminicenantes bacterium]|nr:aminotransferase class I/II-fold pyridoxal phosphate-dependent enzyme [Candidatus Aminicenantes bacterium]